MSKHQKRISAPRSWPIQRKEHYWTVKPRPGAHPANHSIPLLILVRDLLKLADNTKEAKRVLHEGNILVNGKIRKDPKYLVGIFDIISIPKIEKHYRVLTDRKGKLTFTQIKEEDSKTKLCRINNKTIVKGGKVQLNMHDGRNIIGSNDVKRTHHPQKPFVSYRQILQVPYMLFGGRQDLRLYNSCHHRHQLRQLQ